MVWFCADNGPEGGAKDPGQAGGLKGRKRSLYEGGIRVPGIVEWPKGLGDQGRVVKAPAVTSDYLPTVLGAVGLQFPGARPLDGIDLMPLLTGKKEVRGKGIGFTFAGQAAWIEDEWKAILPKKAKDWELYAIAKDPGETADHAGGEVERTREMAQRYAAWKASCDRSRKGKDY
jgi:arylsulfatase A-like enzyme